MQNVLPSIGPFGRAGRRLLLSGCLVAVGVVSARAEDLPSAMLSAHNGARAQHGVGPLSWSPQLAAQAQQWANSCTFQHSPQAFSSYGENLAWGTGWSASQAVGAWYAEGNGYDYNNPIASYQTKKFFHFTQVVWRGSQSLGCGAASCSGQNYYVCRYSPPGNFNGEQPGVLAANVPPPAAAPPPVAPPPGTPAQNNPPPPPVTNPPATAGGGFSAFASDGRGRWGFSVFQADQGRAQGLALNGCGGAGIGCKVFFTTADRCVAYAESRQGGYWFAAGSSTTPQRASNNAIRLCQSGTAPAGSCKATVTRCR